MSIIEDVAGREILDSRGNPTVEVEVELISGARGRAAVPSGASTGAHEAVELRDGGDRYGGKGVHRAVAHVNGEIRDAVIGLDGADQRGARRRAVCPRRYREQEPARRECDPRCQPRDRQGGCRRSRRSRSTGTSAAPTRTCCRCPLMNVLNGGAHADSNVDLQEFMLAPVGAVSFSEALRWGAETYHALHGAVEGARPRRPGLGDEGGFAPNLPSNEEALQALARRDRARRLPARRGDRARARHCIE